MNGHGLITRGTQHEAFNAPDIAIGIELASGRFRRIGDSRRADRDGPLTHQKRKFKSAARPSDLGPSDVVPGR
jgi:hypothetical protein